MTQSIKKKTARMEKNQKNLLELMPRFLPHRDVRVIVEVGARDCTETIHFSRTFPQAHIYTFECNPATLPACRDRVKGIKNITLIEQAVSDKNGTISFFPIDPDKTETTWEDGNPGASSLLRASGKYPIERYVQKKIQVKTTTLKSFLKPITPPKLIFSGWIFRVEN